VGVEREQVATGDLLRRRGFSPRLQAAFLRPLLAGRLLDQELSTSSRFTELMLRAMFTGPVSVPAGGMQRLPEQLADRLPSGAIRFGQRVTAIRDGEVAVDGAAPVRADHVVVATEAPAALDLLDERIPGRQPAPGRGTTTVWFRAPTSPVGGPPLVVEADGGGPVATVAVLSEVAPSYAPEGVSLVAASLIGVPNHSDDQLARIVKAQLHGWYGGQVGAWELLRVDRIAYAQPRQDVVDLPSLAPEVQDDDRTWVCGDHRDTGSIQGALVSRRRTADPIRGR
jgi:phytoene dehydrogenase-like protein